MNRLQSLLLKITPKSIVDIAEVGHVMLTGEVFSLQQATVEDANLADIYQQSLLPRTTSEYITIRDAHRETGLSENWLRELARMGKVEAIKVENKWLLLRESLHQYIQERRTTR